MKIKLTAFFILICSFVQPTTDLERQAQETPAVVEQRRSLFQRIGAIFASCVPSCCVRPVCYKMECRCCLCCFNWDGMMGSNPNQKCCEVRCVRCRRG